MMGTSAGSLPGNVAGPATSSARHSSDKSPSARGPFPDAAQHGLSLDDIDAAFPSECEQYNESSEGKDDPTDFSTPTGIHHLATYPALNDALGEGDIPSVDMDVSKDLAESFSLPQHQDPLSTAVGEQAFCGSQKESDPYMSCRKIGAKSEALAAAMDDPANRSHHFSPNFTRTAGGDTAGGSANASVSDIQGETKTSHISEDVCATEVMISQGTNIQKAGTLEDANSAVDRKRDEIRQSSHHSSDDDASADFHNDAVPIGRVDVDKLEVLENPLSKSDRYTVIKGRLPDSDPFMRAAQNLGLFFMSQEMKAAMGDLRCKSVSEEDRRKFFMRDIEAFNKELSRDYKIPIIGGGQLSLYALAMEVMKLGGLKNVVQNRAFRIVGQQLELPKSCTSAAFVLKTAYEKLIYIYEQKLAFGINPTNPLRTIDMKSVVSEKKRREEDRRGLRGSHRRMQQQHSSNSRRYFPPLSDLPGRISKRRTLDSTTARQLDAIRDAATRELQMADPDGDLLRRGAEDCPDLSMYQGMGMQVERLTPQQPESGSSAFVGNVLPESAIPMQDWAAEAANAMFDPVNPNSLLDQHGSHSEDNKLSGGTFVPPEILNDPLFGHSSFDKQLPPKFTTEQAVYAVFGGNDAVKALQMSAKILHALRQAKAPVKLSEMKNGAGGTLLASIVQGLANYFETSRVSSDGGWRAVIARCAGEMLRILLLVQENQIFVALSKRLWSVAAQILSTDAADEPVVNSLWTAVSIMAPYLPVSIEPQAVVELLQLASEHLKKSSESAVQVAWFISGSIRGLTSKMGPEQDLLIDNIFTSLATYVDTGPEALRHATLTALLHLSRVYPEKGGQTRGLVYLLIKQLTEANSGGLAASTLYYITQASPETLIGFEDLLHAQTNRVVALKSGPQTEQVVSILALLCATEK